MSKKILVVGYYHRNNLGDDVFEYIFKQLFEKYNIKNYNIINIDDLEQIPKDTTSIVFGGGDLINDYFIHKFQSFNTPKICSTYAISVGIPYPKLIDDGYLDGFDMIIHRNKTDKNRLIAKFDEGRARHFPDITYLLNRYIPRAKLSYLPKVGRNMKRIGVFLSRNIYSDRDPCKYVDIVEHLAMFFYRIASMQTKATWFKSASKIYEIVFMPFSTVSDANQNDVQINTDVYNKIQSFGKCDNVKNVTDAIPINQIIPVFESCYMTVCTRFHANVFSAMCNVPMLSVYSSRKVDNFLEEIHMTDYGYKMQVDKEFLYPVELNNDRLVEKFERIVCDHENIYNSLQTFNNMQQPKLDNFELIFRNLLYYPIRNYSPQEIECIAKDKAIAIANCLFKYFTDLTPIESDVFGYDINPTITHDEVYDIAFNNGGVTRFIESVNANKSTAPRIIANIISYVLTTNKISQYVFGIQTSCLSLKYNLFDACKWILQNSESSNTIKYSNLDNNVPIENRKLNMDYIVQHGLKGYHRSGWEYVLDNLYRLHNPNPHAPLFDSYLDKTFGWEYDFLSGIGVLPYTKNWVGVLHHTPNEEYSENNLVNLFAKHNFIKSLPHCKMIIVFSEYLKEWVEERIGEIGNIPDISVLQLYHPTQRVDKCLQFDYPKYKANTNKRIVHVGAWLRNSYSIYELNVPHRFSKCALKGREMDNYFINEDDVTFLEDVILKSYSTDIDVVDVISRDWGDCISRDPKCTNKYLLGLIDLLKRNHRSVEILQMLTNQQYDEILSSNIVFIKLVDASAVNTIIECIMRNTPIIVNRLSATVEYLGHDYPLLYHDINEVANMLKDDVLIRKAYDYLRKMDKTKFTIEYFMDSLINSPVYRIL